MLNTNLDFISASVTGDTLEEVVACLVAGTEDCLPAGTEPQNAASTAAAS